MPGMTSDLPEIAESPGNPRRQAFAIAGAVLLTIPGLALRLTGTHPVEWLAAVLFGVAVVGAAFLLAWGAEVLELDVSQGLSIALLALIAVLPEYAVDFAFTWKAGTNPDKYAPLALANMTGGNRLLIGVGWSMVVLLAAWRLKRIAKERRQPPPEDLGVALGRSNSIGIAFLVIATVYSLTLPLKRSITIVDAVVLIAIFVAYMVRVARAPAGEPHLVGPAQLIGRLPATRRRVVVGVMLAFAAGVILAAAEPFAVSLVTTGETFGISTFLLVQWLAPLASEAPELLVAGLFAWRLNTEAGLGALVSSKVNQWTLLVGSLPIVFMIASNSLHGLPIDALQREELFLTAAQSAFAVAVLANLTLSVKEAFLLLGLFLSQFVLGAVLPDGIHEIERIAVGTLYLVLAAVILTRERVAMRQLLKDGLRTPVAELINPRDEPSLRAGELA
jgi:cation:H+ antiporter